MGLFVDRVQFDGEPPNEEVIRSELLARTGSSYGLDSLVRHPHEIEVKTMMDPVTRPYVLKILYPAMPGTVRDPIPPDVHSSRGVESERVGRLRELP
jgi:hypothetical protein